MNESYYDHRDSKWDGMQAEVAHDGVDEHILTFLTDKAAYKK